MSELSDIPQQQKEIAALREEVKTLRAKFTMERVKRAKALDTVAALQSTCADYERRLSACNAESMHVEHAMVLRQTRTGRYFKGALLHATRSPERPVEMIGVRGFAPLHEVESLSLDEWVPASVLEPDTELVHVEVTKSCNVIGAMDEALYPNVLQALNRPANFDDLSEAERWGIDESLGILDWSPNEAERAIFNRLWTAKRNREVGA